MKLVAKAEGREVYICEDIHGRMSPLRTLSASEATILRASLNEAIYDASVGLLQHKKSALAALQSEIALLEKTLS
jgi:hypothetical protein